MQETANWAYLKISFQFSCKIERKLAQNFSKIFLKNISTENIYQEESNWLFVI